MTSVAKGYRVLSASDGEAGVALFVRHQKEVAIVISDLGLPKFGGDEVFRRIKTIDARARVILASGFIDPDLKSEMLKMGVKCFIQKPYSPSEVLRTVRIALDRIE